MTLQTIKVTLSDQIYRKVRQLALNKNRSVEDEIAAVVENALATDDDWQGVSDDIVNEVNQLRFLNTEQLWSAAKLTVPEEKSDRMQQLSLKLKSEGLVDAEQQELRQLQLLAQRIMLVRAEAASLLQDRGQDISTLHPNPPTG
jgi:post-segregation antitoxin (ccd killing protein)